jgi:tetratricopeptide (TPR) repeat protein
MSSKRSGKAAVKQAIKPTVNKQSNPHLENLLAVREALNLIGKRQFDDARALCQKVLAAAPDLVFANHAMGLIESTLENYAAAEAWLQKAVLADPDNAEYLTNLGVAQMRQDKIDESIKQLHSNRNMQPHVSAWPMRCMKKPTRKPRSSIFRMQSSANRARRGR